MKTCLAFLFALYACAAIAEPVNCNGAHDTVMIPGTVLTVSCPASGTNNPPPIVTPPPVIGCDASQLSSSIGGKTLRRQCMSAMVVLPSGINGGIGFSLADVLGGSWPRYSGAGYSATWTVNAGYYVALSFVPTVSGAIQLAANPSYGDGGIISLSTVPGALSRDAAGAICVLARGGNNSLYVTTDQSLPCHVTIGQTYYINFADVDSIGNNLCYKGRPANCGSSTISYTLYTSQ